MRGLDRVDLDPQNPCATARCAMTACPRNAGSPQLWELNMGFDPVVRSSRGELDIFLESECWRWLVGQTNGSLQDLLLTGPTGISTLYKGDEGVAGRSRALSFLLFRLDTGDAVRGAGVSPECALKLYEAWVRRG